MTVTLLSLSPTQNLLLSKAIGWQVYMSGLFADRTVRRRLNGLAKRDASELDPQVPISTNLKNRIRYMFICHSETIHSLESILYLLFIDEFEVLSWSWPTVSWASVKSRFNSNIIGHFIKRTSFLCPQSKSTATSFRMRWQQSENDCKLDGKTDHVHDWLICSWL